MKRIHGHFFLPKLSGFSFLLISTALTSHAFADDWSSSFGTSYSGSTINASANSQNMNLTSNATITSANANGKNNLSLTVGGSASIAATANIIAIDASASGSAINNITNNGTISAENNAAINLSGYNNSATTSLTNNSDIKTSGTASNVIYVSDNGQSLNFTLSNTNKISSSDSNTKVISLAASNSASSYNINNTNTINASSSKNNIAIDLTNISNGKVAISNSSSILGKIDAQSTGGDITIDHTASNITGAIIAKTGKITITTSGSSTKINSAGTSSDDGVILGSNSSSSLNIYNGARVTGAVVLDGQTDSKAGLIMGTSSATSGGTVSGDVYDSNSHSGNITISGSLLTNSIASIGVGGKVGTVTVEAGSTLSLTSTTATTLNATKTILQSSSSILLKGTNLTTNSTFDGDASLGAGTFKINSSLANVTLGGAIGATTALDTVDVSVGTLNSGSNNINANNINIGTTGTATLNLANATLTGSTKLYNNASLNINGTSSKMSGNISADSNGHGTINVNNDFTAGGDIGASGTALSQINVADEKTFTSGNNIYASSLVLGSSSNANLIMNSSKAVTVSYAISGHVSLTQNGSNSLTLTGNSSSFDGAIIVNTGTLSIASTNNIGTGIITLDEGTLSTSSGGLTFTNSIFTLGDAATIANLDTSTNIFSSNITGGGSLTTKGLVTLAGTDNNYLGTTTVSSGTLSLTGNITHKNSLIVASGATFDMSSATENQSFLDISGAGNINLGANTLTISSADDKTFSGNISGTDGSFVKQGTGLLVFNGTGTYSGTTTVSGGTLEVGDSSHSSASITGDLTLNADATLKGHGSINGNVTNTGGNLSPGGSIGTLTINGDYSQNSLSTLTIELNNTPENSKLVVNGTAHLAGTLVLSPSDGHYSRGVVYTILTADAIDGIFDNIINNNSNAVKLVTTYNSDSVTETVYSTNFSSIASGSNQNNLATVIDNLSTIISSGNFNSTLNSLADLSTTASQVSALNQLNTNLASASSVASINNSKMVISGIKSHLNHSVSSNSFKLNLDNDNITGLNSGDSSNYKLNDLSFWFEAIGNATSLKSHSNISGQDINSGGSLFGIEKDFDQNKENILGVAFAATYSSSGMNNVNQSALSNNYLLSVYGLKQINKFNFDGSLLFGYNNSDTKRYINFLNKTARGSHDGYNIGFDSGISYMFDPYKDLHIIPRLGFSYIHDNQDSYTETGADGANLNIGNVSKNRLESSIGSRFISSFKIPQGKNSYSTIEPQAYVGYTHNFLNADYTNTNSFSGVNSSSFQTKGNGIGNNIANLGLGINYIPASQANLNIYLNYENNVNNNMIDQNVTGGFKLSW